MRCQRIHPVIALSLGRFLSPKFPGSRYFTPADAKAKRTFETEEQQQQNQEEQYKPHLITFEKYLKNCFNYNAKPDFKKQVTRSSHDPHLILTSSSPDPHLVLT